MIKRQEKDVIKYQKNMDKDRKINLNFIIQKEQVNNQIFLFEKIF